MARGHVAKVERILPEKMLQPLDQTQRIVPEVDRAEAGKKIEILLLALIPHRDVAAAAPDRSRTLKDARTPD